MKFSQMAIDYSAGVKKGKDGQIIPNKLGTEVEDLKEAQERARNYKKQDNKYIWDEADLTNEGEER